MNNQTVTYSELNLAKNPKRQQIKPKDADSCFSVSEREITYVGLNLHSASQDLQKKDKTSHCKAAEMSNQRVIYSQVKLAEYPKRQQTKPRSKNSCSISDSEQQITYVGLKLHNAAQDLQGNDKKFHCKAPPGRLIAGILGLLCLVLMASVITMTITVITPYSVNPEQNNSSLIKRTEKEFHWLLQFPVSPKRDQNCPSFIFMFNISYSTRCFEEKPYVSAEMNNQTVSYSEVNLAKKPKRQQIKPKDADSSFSVSEREITYVELNLHSASQDLQKKDKTFHCKANHCHRCLEDWFSYSNHCYYISRDVKNWTESQMACVSKKSNLFYMDNEEEMMFMKILSSSSWIGLSRESSNYSWFWINGSPSNQT
ncbi:NKG2-A/NKG2-B type II integral membrane protein-like [Dugong dugon]